MLVYSTGGNEKEAAEHVVEAWSRGAPGKFKMKEGYRAVADESVTGSALTRSQIDLVRGRNSPFLESANRWASCGQKRDGGSNANSSALIVLRPNSSDACLSGGDCSCDEYPFASTYEGAFFQPATTSVKNILSRHNSSGGGKLGILYNSMRVVDLSYDLNNGLGSREDPTPGFVRVSGGDSFWVAVKESP